MSKLKYRPDKETLKQCTLKVKWWHFKQHRGKCLGDDDQDAAADSIETVLQFLKDFAFNETYHSGKHK